MRQGERVEDEGACVCVCVCVCVHQGKRVEDEAAVEEWIGAMEVLPLAVIIR